MTAILVAFFAVVIVVNVTMARLATSTFGGVVVENSYVASQEFNRWLDEAKTERALGWHAEAVRGRDDRLVVTLAGVPDGATVAALARHPLGKAPDHALTFTLRADGSYCADQPLPAGRWRVRLEIRAAGHLWRTEDDVL